MAEQQPQASSDVQQGESANKPILRISYKVPFSVRIRSIINSITRIFRTMDAPYSSPQEAEEFTPIELGFRFVDSYCDRLKWLYVDPDTQHIPQNRWQVSEIRTYKDKGTKVKHEYLVATLFDAFDNTILLRIERRTWDSVVKSVGHNIVRRKPKGRSTTRPASATPANEDVAKDKDQDKFHKKALDQISIIEPSKFNIKQVPVERIVFKSDDNHKFPTLVDLILLACTVSNYSRQYNLTATNCYWFCYITSEIFKMNFSHDLPDLATRGLRGRWSWRGLGAKVHTSVKFPEVDKNYQNMRQDFEMKINATINNPNSEYAIQAVEERKRAEKLEKRVEEEARLRQEEARLRQEEKIEMERRITELEAKLAQAKAT